MSIDLRNQIGRLSAGEKFELIDALWESLESGVPAMTDEQRTELDERVARYRREPSEVVPWETVKAALLKK